MFFSVCVGEGTKVSLDIGEPAEPEQPQFVIQQSAGFQLQQSGQQQGGYAQAQAVDNNGGYPSLRPGTRQLELPRKPVWAVRVPLNQEY